MDGFIVDVSQGFYIKGLEISLSIEKIKFCSTKVSDYVNCCCSEPTSKYSAITFSLIIQGILEKESHII